MQFADGTPPEFLDDPWPPGMIITVENDSNGLLDLLWVREAFLLHPEGDAPPPLEVAPERHARPDGASDWERAWPDLWEACLVHAATEPDPHAFQRLLQLPEGSRERVDLIRSLTGPSIRESFGDAPFDDSYTAWRRSRLEDLGRKNAVPLSSAPERRALVALIPAWEAGLKRVVTIPCEGEYTHMISPSVLLVTELMRDDPRLYAEALSRFAEQLRGG